MWRSTSSRSRQTGTPGCRGWRHPRPGLGAAPPLPGGVRRHRACPPASGAVGAARAQGSTGMRRHPRGRTEARWCSFPLPSPRCPDGRHPPDVLSALPEPRRAGGSRRRFGMCSASFRISAMVVDAFMHLGGRHGSSVPPHGRGAQGGTPAASVAPLAPNLGHGLPDGFSRVEVTHHRDHPGGERARRPCGMTRSAQDAQ